MLARLLVCILGWATGWARTVKDTATNAQAIA